VIKHRENLSLVLIIEVLDHNILDLHTSGPFDHFPFFLNQLFTYMKTPVLFEESAWEMAMPDVVIEYFAED
jgi:hypothetical protein